VQSAGILEQAERVEKGAAMTKEQLSKELAWQFSFGGITDKQWDIMAEWLLTRFPQLSGKHVCDPACVGCWERREVTR
jgi:hypothetical protein